MTKIPHNYFVIRCVPHSDHLIVSNGGQPFHSLREAREFVAKIDPDFKPRILYEVK